jgi:type IV secretory pathway TrbD component
MLQIFCNLIFPGLGTLFMKKPIIGTIQVLLMLVALILTVTVWLTFFGLVIWIVDLIWALGIGIFWYRSRK